MWTEHIWAICSRQTPKNNVEQISVGQVSVPVSAQKHCFVIASPIPWGVAIQPLYWVTCRIVFLDGCIWIASLRSQ